jgi:hypothetical protein
MADLIKPYSIYNVTLLQKRFIVSAVKSFFISVSPVDTILRIQKIDYFYIGCSQLIPKIGFQKKIRARHVGPRSGPAHRRPSR